MQYSQVLEYLDNFFMWFSPYAKMILEWLSKYVDPYVSKVAEYLEKAANMLPEENIYYIIAMICLIAIGIIFNKVFEK